MGERAFSKIQYGKETTRGTAVAATKMLFAAPISLEPDRTPQYPDDLLGVRARSFRDYTHEYLVRNSIKFDADHPAYFQALPLLFGCGLKGGVTATEQTTSQGDYLWTFTPSLTAANSPDAFTLEVGDDVQAFECEFTQFERIRIAGEVNQEGGAAPVSIDADFYARQWTNTTFTGSLAPLANEVMNSALAQFYLNVSWATVGNTEKTGLLRGFDIEILTGAHPKFHGSGFRYFDTYAESVIDVMATFTLEGNSDADAIWDAFIARTFQVVRLKISGAQIGTGAVHSLTLDIGGTWERVVPLSSEVKGNNLHLAVLHGRYDVTGAKLLQVAVSTASNAY